MKFQQIKHCRRPIREQRYIWAVLEAWHSLPDSRRRELLDVLEGTTPDESERSALYTVLVQGRSPETAARLYYVPVRRLYELRRLFYERVIIK